MNGLIFVLGMIAGILLVVLVVVSVCIYAGMRNELDRREKKKDGDDEE